MAITILFLAIIAFVAIAVFAGSALPVLPQEFYGYVDALVFYLARGMSIVWLFVPQGITVTLMASAVTIRIATWLYKVVMWALRKIPGGIS